MSGPRRRAPQASGGQGFLPPHLRLVALDAWRGEAAQRSLFALCRAALAEAHPEAGEEELLDMVRGYILAPEEPFPHGTGGAVDLTLTAMDGALLWFGGPYNHPGPVSRTRHFEERLEAGEILDEHAYSALENRRILHAAMTGAGFVNYPGEWWHFEYGTRRWALLSGRGYAVYGGIRPRLNPFETYARS
ncbi:M15 family metallopeptidase [Desulfocurvus sp. DL9XJH121]